MLAQRGDNITDIKCGRIYFRREIHFQDVAYFFPTSPPSLILNLHVWGKKKLDSVTT